LKSRNILIILAILLTVVFTSCYFNEIAWRNKENTLDPVRLSLRMSSLAIGNLSPSARNPGLEFFCTGLYDTPGGYCSYFTDGVPFINFRFGGNITLGVNIK
jgi:hypothetical protein